jgi:multidrug efflux pump subunit AcrA (membrane-fusion protein)
LLQELENQLSLYPDLRKVSQAQVHVNESKTSEAKRSLQKTTINLPQDLRISAVNIEENQVVNVQQVMVEAHRIDVMEVEAQLSIHDMQLLISGGTDPATQKFQAHIELSSGDLKATWPAEVTRFSDSVDANQATVGVILEITQDSKALANLPLLVSGMFVSAEIEGMATANWVIPERALHGDKIYINDANSKLDIRSVEVLYRRDNQVVIKGNFEDGDKLILNDLLPAIKGMLLKESSTDKTAEDAS